MKKKHALVYIRVSTEKQAQTGVSLETQRERCVEFAVEAGYTVGKKDFFVDAGESARTMARPALIELMECAKADATIEAVVVYDISRLARNRLDFALVKQVLRKEGVSLLSATEPIDETPEGQMLEGVLSTVAEFFSAQSGRKVKVNMEKKARDGGWPALAPYGYLPDVNYLCATATIRSVHPPFSSRRRRGRWAVGNAQRFPRGVGGCRRQPSTPRQAGGRGDGGAGEEGAISTASVS